MAKKVTVTLVDDFDGEGAADEQRRADEVEPQAEPAGGGHELEVGARVGVVERMEARLVGARLGPQG